MADEVQVNAAFDPSKLQGLSLEDLKKLMDETRKQIKAQSKSVDSAEDQAKREALKPYEEETNAVQERFTVYKKKLAAKLKEAREEYKTKIAIAKKELDDAKDKLNAKRRELGMRASRAASAGPQTSWHVEVDIDAMEAEVGIKDRPETFVKVGIDEMGRAKMEEIREKVVKANDVEDEGGGKGRGILNRIKAQFSSKVEQRQNGGTAPEGSAPPQNEEQGNEEQGQPEQVGAEQQ